MEAFFQFAGEGGGRKSFLALTHSRVRCFFVVGDNELERVCHRFLMRSLRHSMRDVVAKILCNMSGAALEANHKRIHFFWYQLARVVLVCSRLGRTKRKQAKRRSSRSGKPVGVSVKHAGFSLEEVPQSSNMRSGEARI